MSPGRERDQKVLTTLVNGLCPFSYTNLHPFIPLNLLLAEDPIELHISRYASLLWPKFFFSSNKFTNFPTIQNRFSGNFEICLHIASIDFYCILFFRSLTQKVTIKWRCLGIIWTFEMFFQLQCLFSSMFPWFLFMMRSRYRKNEAHGIGGEKVVTSRAQAGDLWGWLVPFLDIFQCGWPLLADNKIHSLASLWALAFASAKDFSLVFYLDFCPKIAYSSLCLGIISPSLQLSS